jgi:endonuclease-3
MSERSAFETPAIKRIEEEKPFEYIVQHLENAFGEPVLKEKSDPLAMLIRVILSQATTDALSRRTFENLKRRFKSWAQAAEAAEVEIADAIKLGGLSGQKAAVIKNLLAEVKMRSGAFSLDFLEEMPADEARDLLLGFRGIGPKTAACTLLFALHKEVFPLDTHIFRVLKRMGILPERISDLKAHKFLDRIVPPGKFYSLHVNLIRLGRTVCRPREPLCERCPLIEYCDYGMEKL